MAQKYAHCELCGEYALVADYGFHKEFICVECTLKDDKLSDHVTKEMLKRHGQTKMKDIVDDIIGERTRN